MKKNLIIATVLAVSISGASFGQQEKLTVSSKASSIEWTGKKVTGQHMGTISLKEGWVDLDKGKLVDGMFTLDMTSINVTDLEGKMKSNLEGHLSSPDFFDVAKHKTGTFTIAKVEAMEKPEAGNTHTISGKLTLKGISKDISFPAKVEVTDGKLAAVAAFKIDRTDWDIKYGSGKFFEGLGDKAISDDIELKLQLAAKK